MGNMFKSSKDGNSKIGKDSFCPICKKMFSKRTTYIELNDHIDECTKNFEKAKEEKKSIPKDILLKKKIDELFKIESVEQMEKQRPKKSITVKNNMNQISNFNFNHHNLINNMFPIKNDKKIFTNNNLIMIDKSHNFEQKMQIFRLAMKGLKTSWTEGACTLELTRDNILNQSIKQIKTLDLYKELKIHFKGEVSNDAGGLIREWYTIILKELQSKEKDLFEPSDTEEFSYLINGNIQQTIDNLDIFNFIGKIIGKALLDNLTINSCFNKYIFMLLIGEPITFESLIFINKSLYNSLNELKKIDDLSSLGLYYELHYKVDGRLVTDELIPNGSNIQVVDINDYIEQRLKYMINKDKIFINELKAGLTSIIPSQYITCFNSDEIELLINGVPFIDLDEWKMFTTYKNKYSINHKNIKWFWEILDKYNQKELRNILQFCTGTTRVPIGGFAALESNRGEISHFCLVSVDYYPKKKNYIKAHTCFNRVDIPVYPNKNELIEALDFIVKNEIFGFGID